MAFMAGVGCSADRRSLVGWHGDGRGWQGRHWGGGLILSKAQKSAATPIPALLAGGVWTRAGSQNADGPWLGQFQRKFSPKSLKWGMPKPGGGTDNEWFCDFRQFLKVRDLLLCLKEQLIQQEKALMPLYSMEIDMLLRNILRYKLRLTNPP